MLADPDTAGGANRPAGRMILLDWLEWSRQTGISVGQSIRWARMAQGEPRIYAPIGISYFPVIGDLRGCLYGTFWMADSELCKDLPGTMLKLMSAIST